MCVQICYFLFRAAVGPQGVYETFASNATHNSVTKSTQTWTQQLEINIGNNFGNNYL